MALKHREYLLSVDNFNEPQIVEGKPAIGLMLIRLILLEPGSDPLHPDMGVGLKNYRFGLNQLDDLKTKIEEQLEKFLPQYQNAGVTLISTPDKMLNIEITIDGITYIYDSSKMPVSISLDQIQQ